MADSPAPVEAYTIDGYDDAWGDQPDRVRIAMIIGGVSGLVLVAGGLLLASGGKLREKERLPRRSPTSWAFEGRRRRRR